MLLASVRDTMLQAMRSPLQRKPVISTSSEVLEFLQAALGHQPVEVVWAFYLDAANHLLCDEAVSRGSVTEAVIYPRELIRRALELGATGIVLAHNHPSGSAVPSRSDVEMTRRLAIACREVEIAIHDHLIVTNAGWTSLRLEGLLDG